MDRPIRIAIVEDNETDLNLLEENLHRYEQEKKVQFVWKVFRDGEDLVTDYSADYDLILLDIMMHFMDGMTAARKIREMDSSVTIVFITNTPQYAIEGYKVGAADYVLKPISWFSFSESLTRVFRIKKPELRQFVTIALKGGKIKVDMDRICYVEVQDHQLVYNTLDGKYISKGIMRDLEEQLKGTSFYRCNRCYVVNLRYVEAYIGSDIHVNGDIIQVSRSRRKGFMDALNTYMNGNIS